MTHIVQLLYDIIMYMQEQGKKVKAVLNKKATVPPVAPLVNTRIITVCTGEKRT